MVVINVCIKFITINLKLSISTSKLHCLNKLSNYFTINLAYDWFVKVSCNW